MQSGVVLPDALVLLITGFVMFVVTQGVKNVLSWFGVDLSGLAAGITAAVVGVIVALLNGWLGMIPPEWAPIANQVLQLIVLLLTGFGAYRIYQGLKQPPYTR